MSDVTLTAAMRSNLLSLQSTSSLMDTTQTRISTGKKVNSAIDNPTAYFTSKNLTDKAADFAALKDSMGQAISSVQTADKAITAITDLVKQAKSLANSAKSAATNAERANLASQFDDLRGQIDELADDATYNGVNLVKGRGVIAGGTWTVSGKADADAFSSVGALTVSEAASAEEGTFNMETQVQLSGTGNQAVSGGVFTTTAGTQTLDVKVGTSTAAGGGWTNVNEDISITIDATGTNLTVSNGTYSQTIATSEVDVTGAAATKLKLGTLDVELQFSADATAGLTWNANATQADAFDTSADATVADARVEMTYGNSVAYFDSGTLSHTINGVTLSFASITDASVVAGEAAQVVVSNATGTGQYDMRVSFNADNSAYINVEAVDATASGLAIGAATGSWANNSDIEAAITDIDAALSTLRSHAQALSTNLGVIQTREDFTSNFINELEVGADKLTLADGNEEATNMLMLQTRQQLGTQALSMASSSAQSILALFR